MTTNKRKPRNIALAVVALVIFLLIEWRPWHSLDYGEPEVDPASQKVQKQEVSAETNELPALRAQLTPERYTTVAAELGAKVQDIPFREGETFKVGDTLVQFDCSTQQAQWQKTKSVMAIAERNYNTNKKLLALGSVGRIEYENSASEYQKTKAEADELAAVVAKCTIKAPFDGRVVEQKVRAQQFVQAGQPVIDILDNSALELEFVVPSKWSPWLVESYKFQIKIDETGKSYPAKITRVGARIDPISQTFKVAAVIDGDFQELAPGMSGTVEIQPPQ